MADGRERRTARGRLASQVDAMTLAAVAVLLAVAAWTAAELGPAEALDRVGCGLNAAVNGLLAYPRPCR